MSKELITKYVGWAIDTNSEDGYLGPWIVETSLNMSGHDLALFDTRFMARHFLSYAKMSYPQATVRKVCIYVEQA